MVKEWEIYKYYNYSVYYLKKNNKEEYNSIIISFIDILKIKNKLNYVTFIKILENIDDIDLNDIIYDISVELSKELEGGNLSLVKIYLELLDNIQNLGFKINVLPDFITKYEMYKKIKQKEKKIKIR